MNSSDDTFSSNRKVNLIQKINYGIYAQMLCEIGVYWVLWITLLQYKEFEVLNFMLLNTNQGMKVSINKIIIFFNIIVILI